MVGLLKEKMIMERCILHPYDPLINVSSCLSGFLCGREMTGEPGRAWQSDRLGCAIKWRTSRLIVISISRT